MFVYGLYGGLFISGDLEFGEEKTVGVFNVGFLLLT